MRRSKLNFALRPHTVVAILRVRFRCTHLASSTSLAHARARYWRKFLPPSYRLSSVTVANCALLVYCWLNVADLVGDWSCIRRSRFNIRNANTRLAISACHCCGSFPHHVWRMLCKCEQYCKWYFRYVLYFVIATQGREWCVLFNVH